jgi:hypothetical protein
MFTSWEKENEAITIKKNNTSRSNTEKMTKIPVLLARKSLPNLGWQGGGATSHGSMHSAPWRAHFPHLARITHPSNAVTTLSHLC